MTHPEELLPPMKWNAWGDPAAAKPLSDGIRSLLKQAVGLEDSDAGRTRAPTRCSCARRRCRRPIGTRWPRIVGAEYCRTADRDRLLHAGGKSTLDLLRRKDTGVQDAPDAVLLPGGPDGEDTVAAILRYCSEHGIAVDPVRRRHQRRRWTRSHPRRVRRRGVARSAPLRPAASRSTRCPAQAVFGAGVTGPDAERLLGEHGFSLGHFPQSFEYATIGGFAATRSSGQDSAGYGRFDDMVRGLRMVTPGGHAGPGPRTGNRPPAPTCASC